MATERCKRCHEESTPWEYREDLKGHICYDCSVELRELRESEKAGEVDGRYQG
jgi:hypothetical protein